MNEINDDSSSRSASRKSRNASRKASPKTFAEFFAGVGLVRMGLSQAGWRCLFANDHDPKKEAIYNQNFKPSHYLLGDIHKVKREQAPEVCLATASFPCVDVSLAGARRGLKGAESSAFYGFTRLLKKMGSSRPPLILIENVPGLLTSGGGKDIVDTLKELNKLGYKTDMFTVDARWFSPQSRMRLFIVGNRSGSQGDSKNNFARRDERMRPKRITDIVGSPNGVKWSFIDLPFPPDETSIKLSDLIERDGSAKWFDAEKVAKLKNRLSSKHREKVEELMGKKSIEYRAAYQRVRKGVVRLEPRFDRLSGCLRPPRGGSSKQILLMLGRGTFKARFFTAREYARLQGVPDKFELPGRESEGLFALGDAVSVPVIRWIGEQGLNPLVR